MEKTIKLGVPYFKTRIAAEEVKHSNRTFSGDHEKEDNHVQQETHTQCDFGQSVKYIANSMFVVAKERFDEFWINCLDLEFNILWLISALFFPKITLSLFALWEIVLFCIAYVQKRVTKENKKANPQAKYEKIQTLERFYEVLDELKDDAVILSGNENAFTDFVQNLSDSQIAHVQYLHYLGEEKNENKNIRNNYEIIESAITRDANGVSVNSLYNDQGNKLLQDASRFERFYIAKIDWNKVACDKKAYKKRIESFIKKVRDREFDIPYDFGACSSLTIRKVLRLFGFENGFEIIEEKMAKWIQTHQDGLINVVLSYVLGKFKLFFFQKNQFTSMICTELVGYLFRKGGIIKQDLNISVFTPQDILELDIYDKLYGFDFDSHFVPNEELYGFSSNRELIRKPTNKRDSKMCKFATKII